MYHCSSFADRARNFGDREPGMLASAGRTERDGTRCSVLRNGYELVSPAVYHGEFGHRLSPMMRSFFSTGHAAKLAEAGTGVVFCLSFSKPCRP